MKAPALGWQLLLAFVLSLLVLAGLIGWLQNVHIVTTNGMYKSMQARPWIADPGHARLDPSNYLYFPLYGAMSRLFDAFGILRGVAWKQFAYFNAFWASLGSVFVYAFAHRFTGSARVAMAATSFHLGCGFVLLLAVINEDIMPGYVVVLASMLLAALSFDRPTYPRVIAIAALFTLGWLIEWRLIFPTLPAFMLALAISPGTLRRRAALIGTLLVTIVATAGIVQQLWEGHSGAVGLHDLLWTGKGVDSGWAGLSWDKVWLLLSGIGSYFVMEGNARTAAMTRQSLGSLGTSVLLQAVILGGCIVQLWRRRMERRLWSVAAVFLGTFGAGEIFNVYSQPDDPQMQINVMAWLAVAWALLVAAMPKRPAVWPVLAVLSLAPLAWNGFWLSGWRGGDARALAAMAEIDKRFPSDSTVFVYLGFEPITTWHFLLWSNTWDWDGEVAIGPAPSDNPRFKWIAINAGAIRHPRWSAEQHARTIKHDIDMALDRGYRVVVSNVWTWSSETLADQLATMAGANRAEAIHAMLHGNYSAGPGIDVPYAGTYYELHRRH